MIMSVPNPIPILIEAADVIFPVDRPVGQPLRDGTARALTVLGALLAIILVVVYQVLIRMPESWQQRLLGDTTMPE